MKDMESSFGLLIAYALPGFVAIWGVSGIWPTLFECASDTQLCDTLPSLAGFLNSTVAAIASGMTVSAIQFVLIDSLHERSGLKRPTSNGIALQKNLAAVRIVIDHHYRYYQFHANMIVAGVIAYAAHLYDTRTVAGLPEVLLLALAIVFWIASRDNLKKYYLNLDAIFQPHTERMNSMSNGMNHHHDEPKTEQQNKGKVTAKPNDKREQDEKPATTKAPVSKLARP